MTLCQGTLLVCLGLLPVTEPGADRSPALLLWEQGQEAMLSGQTDDALGLYRKSLKLDPTLARNYLSGAYLAAALACWAN